MVWTFSKCTKHEEDFFQILCASQKVGTFLQQTWTISREYIHSAELSLKSKAGTKSTFGVKNIGTILFSHL